MAQKLAIRDFIREQGVPYTFIDIGWWMQLYLPLPLRSKAPTEFKAITWRLFGQGEARNLVTNCDHTGTYVARIIADPRTLNHSVIIWDDKISRLEAQETGERVSGEGEALKARRVYVSLFPRCSLLTNFDLYARVPHRSRRTTT